MEVIVTIKKLLPKKLKREIKGFMTLNPFDPQLKNEKKLFVFGTPTHGNLGDQAIAYAQEKFLEKYFPNVTVIEIPDIHTVSYIRSAKAILHKEDIIFIHGGGNIGDLYLQVEEERREVIRSFPNNKIIQFPQSYTFTKEGGGKEVVKSDKIYQRNKQNLTIVARETKSSQKFRDLFKENNHLLVPDIVLSLDERRESKRNGILLCLRNDVEGILSGQQQSSVITALKEKYSQVTVTDTVVDYRVFQQNRYEELNKKWDEYRQSQVVITDRLHGMIFAAITGTPCIVFDNFNQKIQKTYFDWLQELDSIRFVDVLTNFNMTDIKEEVAKLIDHETKMFEVGDKYQPLIDEIRITL